MQCMCGDIASTKTVVRKACAAELDFYECRTCARVSDGVLYVEEIEVLADAGMVAHARLAFNELTSPKAQQLLELAKRKLEAQGRINEEMRLEIAQNAFDF